MASAASLSEPRVLAHTKRRLFPDSDEENAYAVVDTQFAVEEWKGSRKRFCDVAPEWGLLTRRVVWAYPGTQLFVEELQTMHDDGIREPSLVEFVEWLHVQHPTFTVELFLRGNDDVRSRVLDEKGDLQTAELADGTIRIRFRPPQQ